MSKNVDKREEWVLVKSPSELEPGLLIKIASVPCCGGDIIGIIKCLTEQFCDGCGYYRHDLQQLSVPESCFFCGSDTAECLIKYTNLGQVYRLKDPKITDSYEVKEKVGTRVEIKKELVTPRWWEEGE